MPWIFTVIFFISDSSIKRYTFYTNCFERKKKCTAEDVGQLEGAPISYFMPINFDIFSLLLEIILSLSLFLSFYRFNQSWSKLFYKEKSRINFNFIPERRSSLSASISNCWFLFFCIWFTFENSIAYQCAERFDIFFLNRLIIGYVDLPILSDV